MTHDTLALITTLLLGVAGFFATMAYQDVRNRLGNVETTQRLHTTVMYHMATQTPIPKEFEKKLKEAMVNGKKE